MTSAESAAGDSAAERAEERAWRRFGPQSVERAMLERLSDLFGVALRPRVLELRDGNRTELEGIDADDSVVVQMVGNSGNFRSQHRNKVMADMFKLAWLRAAIFPDARIVLCVSETVAQAFSATAWTTSAARDLGIEVYVHAADGVTALERR
jgi:hypothetical protein